MRRVLWAALAGLSWVALLVTPQSASAFRVMLPPPTIAQRVVTADTIVVGKVTSIEEMTVKAEQFPGLKQTAEYRIAVVKIDQAIVGASGLTHLKVGFLAPVAVKPGAPGGPVRPGFPRPLAPQDITLVKGQDACLFLKQHHKESFYVASSMQGSLIDRKALNFGKDLAEIKRIAKLLDDPMAGLKARSAAERFQTAALLVQRYRSFQAGNKQEPISAEESKLILDAIAGGNWNVQPIVRPGAPVVVTPLSVFNQLGLQPQDGWTPPRDFRQVPAAARAWLKANAATYRIQRFVAEKAEKDEK
jgi:hypothetical protein